MNINFILSNMIFLGIILYIIKNYINKKYLINKNFYKNFKELFKILLITFIIKSLLLELYYIPSESMMPTLIKNDYIFVNKLAYYIKNPFNNKILYTINNPKYNDIIVFKYPKNININYIKRIIALPNDKIIYNEKFKQIYIYKQCNLNILKYCLTKIIKYDNKIKTIFIFNNNKSTKYLFRKHNNIYFKKNIKWFLILEYNEYIQNKKHKIWTILNKKFNLNKKIKTWIIPSNKYFVMGDFRDNSYDSRNWGYIDKNLIIGKASYIWLNIIYFNKWKWYINFNRIGSIS